MVLLEEDVIEFISYLGIIISIEGDLDVDVDLR